MNNQLVDTISPAPREVWKRVLESSEEAGVFQTPAWLDCICATGSYEDASRLYETRDGRQLVLPMVRRTRLPARLATEASLPANWGPGGLVAPGRVRADEVAAVLRDLNERRLLRISLKPGPLTATAWVAAVPPGIVTLPHVVHLLDLEGGFDQVWSKRFPSKTRTKLRKAEQAGLVIECDTTGRLMPIFYDLYLRWVERRARESGKPLPLARWLAQRQEPLHKYQLVAERLGDACRIWVAWLGGQPAAASIILLQGANANYWRSASDKELAGRTRANDLIQKFAIEDACRAGCRYYHMGESGGVTSLTHFKERFGAQARQYLEYRLERVPLTGAQQRLDALTRHVTKHLVHLASEGRKRYGRRRPKEED